MLTMRNGIVLVVMLVAMAVSAMGAYNDPLSFGNGSPSAIAGAGSVHGSLPAGNTIDADTGTFGLLYDEDSGTAGIQNYVIYDMGSARDINAMYITSRDNSSTLNPKDITWFYYKNDTVTTTGYSQIGTDSNVAVLDNTDSRINGLHDGWNYIYNFDNNVNRRYIGMRIESSYETANTQFAEMRFSDRLLPKSIAHNSSFHSTLTVNNSKDRKGDTFALSSSETGYIVFDLGSVCSIEELRLFSRESATTLANPKDYQLFYYADDNPADNGGGYDDIAGDTNIVEIANGTLSSLTNGDSETISFSSIEKRYIGLRVNSSYAEGNFQIGEVDFAGSTIPEPMTLSLLMLSGGAILFRRRT